MSLTERSYRNGIYLELSADREQVLRRARELGIQAEVRRKIESGAGDAASGLVTEGRLCQAGIVLISKPLLMVVFGSCKPRQAEVLSGMIREKVDWIKRTATER